MKIVGFCVVGPKEADRYLKATLDEFKRLCDDVLIACNNTDPQTEELITQYGFKWYRDDREWGKYQPLIKTKLLQSIAYLEPTHILALDSDEVFVNVNRRDLEAMADNLGSYFYIVNLWNEPDRYIPELSFWNIRFYKFDPKLTQFIAKNLHCGLAPLYAYQVGKYVPFMVKHYGLMNPKDRAKKVDRYAKYDPKAEFKSKSFYDALSVKAEGKPLDIAQLQVDLNKEVEKMGPQNKKLTDNTIMEYVYLVKDGKNIDVPKGTEKHYIKNGWKLIANSIAAKPKEEAWQPPVVDVKAEPAKKIGRPKKNENTL